MLVDYEEKTFEIALNHELLGTSRNVFAPGQVFEAVLGFDAGVYTRLGSFWKLWPFGRRDGVVLEDVRWHGGVDDSTKLPPFRLNLFLQHKRPEYMTAANAKEWSHWSSPYFRYDIDQAQQKVLEAGARAVGRSALVAYSCPAVENAAGLFDAIAGGTLVNNTNFVEAEKLRGHERYTFQSAGASGWACSEPERVDGFAFFEEVETRASEQDADPLAVAEQAVLAMLDAHPSLSGRDEELQRFARDLAAQVIEILALGNVRRPARRGRHFDSLRRFFLVSEVTGLLGLTWLAAERRRMPDETNQGGRAGRRRRRR